MIGSPVHFRRRASATRASAAAVVLALLALSGCGGGQSAAEPTVTKPVSAVAPAGPTSRMLDQLRLVNYYPSTGGWNLMWTRWNPTKIDHDFARIAGLGGNAVRIIIQPSAVGFPEISPTMSSRLGDLVSMARSHGLKVQLTLFDLWDDYHDTSQSSTWAASVLADYRSDPEVAFVELQNEINPYVPAAMSWARKELPILRSLCGTVPVTVSVTGTDTSTTLTALKAGLQGDQPDFYDVHFYGPAGSAYSQFAEDKAIAAPLPLIVGETGYPTMADVAGSEPAAEANQDLYLRSVMWAAQSLALPVPAPWIFQDFTADAIPSNLHARPSEYHLGLIRTDGSAKIAAASMQAVFTSGEVSTTTNLDFTLGYQGVPLYWQRYDRGQGTFLWTPTGSPSGGGSVGLTDTSGTSAAVPSYTLDPVEVPIKAGETFTAGAWVRSVAATGFNRISIAWFGASGLYLGQSESPAAPLGTTGWTQLAVVSSAPAGAQYEQLNLKSAHNSGTIWFSDATISPED